MRSSATTLLVIAGCTATAAAEPVSFRRDVAPLLEQHCSVATPARGPRAGSTCRPARSCSPAGPTAQRSCRARRPTARSSGSWPRHKMPPEEAAAGRGGRGAAPLGGRGGQMGGRARSPPPPRKRAGRDWWSLQPIRRPRRPGARRPGLGRQPDRRLRAGRPGASASRPEPGGRSPHADPPGHLRPDRPAADARGGRRLRRRPVAGRLREAGRPAAGVAAPTASAGPGTGSTWSASPRATATR